VVAARQDLHLDEDGHRVSVLFNRPVASGENLVQAFGADAIFNGQGLTMRRPRPISGAALQSDGRIVNLNFDHILSKNAAYELRVGSLVDPLTGSAAPLGATVQPAVDNDRPAGLLFGKVLRADSTPVAGAEVALSVFSDASLPRPDSVQFDATEADGVFFYEFVPRDPILGYHGLWRLDAVDAEGKAASLSAAVREPGSVQVVNLVYLGRGAAEGYVRYDDGTKASGATVTVGSTMRGEAQIARADANGFYRVENLPVGPLTFSARDGKGRIAFAANEVRAAGGVVVQDLVIPLGELTGSGSVRGTVIRSDDDEPVAGARVGIFSRGYAVGETYTGADGRFAFESVPAGYVTVLASEWSVSRVAAAQDFDLRADATRELTMILEVAPEAAPVRVAGSVTRADPLNPAARRAVPAAVVKIDGLGVVTADATGAFVFDQVPPSLAGRKITAWDPESGRAASRPLPSPLAPSSSVDILVSAQESGTGTIRVRLVDAAGFPLDGFDVFVPGYPNKKQLQGKSDGIYELTAPVGRSEEIWAVARGGGYGSQYASGRATVAFEGQVAPLNLRLPGQGRVRVAVRSDIDLIADVTISYMTWDEGMQSPRRTTLARSTQDAGGGAGFAIFDGVPALAQFTVSSAHPVHGAASAGGRLAFDGDLQTLTLQLDRLASLEGVVYAIDGRTPIAGAAVRIVDERQDQGATLSGPDGSFSFENLPAGASVRAIATVAQDGIYRTGYAEARTPATGGTVENVGVVLRRRGTIKARVVYAGYRVFDPQNPSNNVPDDTPGDFSDNAPVRRARLALRELGFPSRSFGTATEPLVADEAGRFDVGNVFEGPLRASAWDPGNQELRGEWSGALMNEGDEVAALIGIGGAGVGSLEARVVDPMQADAPVLNAELLLLRRVGTSWDAFDFASTDGAGEASFETLPAGEYRLQAYSKAEGRSGASGVVIVAANARASVAIDLEHRGVVAGQVLDPEEPVASDRPVAGSHVTLDALNYDTRTTTDATGSFRFEGVREGTFALTARDPDSNRRASAVFGLTEANGYELTGVVLALEPTATLRAEVYLPADDGSSSGVLAPAIGVDVKQRCSTSNFVEFCDFYASLQENPAGVAGMRADGTYHVAVREIGGQQRTVSASGEFPNGSAASPIRLVLPAFGSVRVQVIQAGQPAAGARVTASGGGKQA
ncbi:MAG TPA: carboxypeptidase-like regulatory domain-containing protein, partial [Thermoanaerobaculia bacterium]